MRVYSKKFINLSPNEITFGFDIFTHQVAISHLQGFFFPARIKKRPDPLQFILQFLSLYSVYHSI